MGNIKDININFFHVMINIRNFDSSLLKLDKKSFKNIAIYYIGYITKKDKYAINSVNPLYLISHDVDGFIEEKEGNFAFTDSCSEVSKECAEIWKEIKDQIEKINSGKLGEYGKN